jgi:hypothetical protein
MQGILEGSRDEAREPALGSSTVTYGARSGFLAAKPAKLDRILVNALNERLMRGMEPPAPGRRQ